MKSCLSVPKAFLSLLLYSILLVHFQSHHANEIVEYRHSSSFYLEKEESKESNFPKADELYSSNVDSASEVLQDSLNQAATLSTLVPFFIGAGLGTTGTTTLYSAMCMMGFPSVHFRRSCIHPVALPISNHSISGASKNQSNFDTVNVLESTSHNQKSKLSLQMEADKAKGVLAHRRLLQSWRSLRVCTRRSRQTKMQNAPSMVTHSQACKNFTGLVDNLFHQASQVVSSGLSLVTDTPYPFLMDIVLQAAKKHRPITAIILTEREPQSWVSSRLRHHISESDLMCFHPANAFDLPKCLEQNRQYSSPKQKYNKLGMTPSPPTREYNVKNLTFQHSEILGGNYSSREKDQYRSFLANSMDQHHTKIKNMMKGRIIVINLWKEDLPTVPDLALALWERMEPIVPPNILQQYKRTAIPLQSIRR